MDPFNTIARTLFNRYIYDEVDSIETAIALIPGEEFETVSANLRSNPYVITYNGDDIDYITYTVGAGTIVKTFNYTLGVLTSIVLSGDTPAGITLTKTLNYTGDDLTSVIYS